MKKIVLSLPVLLALLTGCSEPTIDASTDEAMKASINEVRQSLPEERRAKFDESVKVIAFSQISFKDLLADGASGTDTTKDKVRDALDGKSAEEIIAAAEQIEQQIKAEKKAKALSEIEALENKKSEAATIQSKIAQFTVSNPSFYKKAEQYIGDIPFVDVTVKNGTSQPVANVTFNGALTSPNRSVPWLEDTISYSIPGGLEPGEEAQWSIRLNQFSKWGEVDAPEDAVLTMVVKRLSDADHKSLFPVSEFSERDAQRLAELKTQYDQ